MAADGDRLHKFLQKHHLAHVSKTHKVFDVFLKYVFLNEPIYSLQFVARIVTIRVHLQAPTRGDAKRGIKEPLAAILSSQIEQEPGWQGVTSLQGKL